MARSLAPHLGLRLLALVMSGVVLAPKVIHAYDLTRNDNVRPFCRIDRRGEYAYSSFSFDRFPARCVCLQRLTAPRLASMPTLTMVQLLGSGRWK